MKSPIPHSVDKLESISFKLKKLDLMKYKQIEEFKLEMSETEIEEGNIS